MKQNFKSFTIKENKGFRLRVESWESLSPKGLMAIEFVQECLDDKGGVDSSSVYSYNMTKEEISNLCKGLLEV